MSESGTEEQIITHDDQEEYQDAERDEVEDMKKQLASIEEEAKKLEEMQAQGKTFLSHLKNLRAHKIVESATSIETDNKGEVDSRSVFVGNVDFSTTQAELEAHFKGFEDTNLLLRSVQQTY